jgi:SAM-dependent methyltransferase
MIDNPNNEKNKKDSNNSINQYYSDSSSEWSSAEYALEYLEIAEQIPHKNEGEKVLLEYIPADVKRILDLGTGDGRLIKLIKSNKQQQQQLSASTSTSTSLSPLTPEITVVDVSPTMLEKVRNYFKHDSNDVTIIEHDLTVLNSYLFKHILKASSISLCDVASLSSEPSFSTAVLSDITSLSNIGLIATISDSINILAWPNISLCSVEKLTGITCMCSFQCHFIFL